MPPDFPRVVVPSALPLKLICDVTRLCQNLTPLGNFLRTPLFVVHCLISAETTALPVDIWLASWESDHVWSIGKAWEVSFKAKCVLLTVPNNWSHMKTLQGVQMGNCFCYFSDSFIALSWQADIPIPFRNQDRCDAPETAKLSVWLQQSVYIAKGCCMFILVWYSPLVVPSYPCSEKCNPLRPGRPLFWPVQLDQP